MFWENRNPSETEQNVLYLLSMLSMPLKKCVYLSFVWDRVMITAVAEVSN